MIKRINLRKLLKLKKNKKNLPFIERKIQELRNKRIFILNTLLIFYIKKKFEQKLIDLIKLYIKNKDKFNFVLKLKKIQFLYNLLINKLIKISKKLVNLDENKKVSTPKKIIIKKKITKKKKQQAIFFYIRNVKIRHKKKTLLKKKNKKIINKKSKKKEIKKNIKKLIEKNLKKNYFKHNFKNKNKNFQKPINKKKPKKIKKHVIIRVLFTKNNMHITISNQKNKVLKIITCGAVIKKGRKRTAYAIRETLHKMYRFVRTQQYRKFILHLKGMNPNKYRFFSKIAFMYRVNYYRYVLDNDNTPHNGCKSRKAKRK